jgi:hypothetical protein
MPFSPILDGILVAIVWMSSTYKSNGSWHYQDFQTLSYHNLPKFI